MRRARQALALGMALGMLGLACAAPPPSVDARQRSAYAAALRLAADDAAAGQRALGVFLSRYPDSALATRAALRLAELQVAAGAPGAAIRNLAQQLAQQPTAVGSDQARLLLARLYSAAGRPLAGYRAAREIRFARLSEEARPRAWRLLANLAPAAEAAPERLRWLAELRAAAAEEEAQRKLPELAQRLAPSGCAPPRWHFIGQLQRNKARWAARLFDCIESVDRLSLARDLDRHAAEAGRRLDILVQVKLGAAAQRGGVNPGELTGLLDGLTALPHLRIRGLMGIPPAGATPEQTRAAFARLRGLRDAAGAAVLPELSMGMSADFELAIAEGATIIRLGRALFGGREGAAGAQAA